MYFVSLHSGQLVSIISEKIENLHFREFRALYVHACAISIVLSKVFGEEETWFRLAKLKLDNNKNGVSDLDQQYMGELLSRKAGSRLADEIMAFIAPPDT